MKILSLLHETSGDEARLLRLVALMERAAGQGQALQSLGGNCLKLDMVRSCVNEIRPICNFAIPPMEEEEQKLPPSTFRQELASVAEGEAATSVTSFELFSSAWSRTA